MTWLDMFLKGSTLNTQDWSNAQYDDLIKKAQVEMDLAKRADMLKQAEKILLDEQAVTPLYFAALGLWIGMVRKVGVPAERTIAQAQNAT